MRKYLFLITIATLISCITEEDFKNQPEPRFKVGDTAYVKPDSLKCTIYYYNSDRYNPHYAIRYVDKNGIMQESGTGWKNSLISENGFH